MSDKTNVVCLDPGHGPKTVNGSPDGTYKEREFTWDMYQRIKPILEARGIKVVCTRVKDEKPSLTKRCLISNAAHADLLISIHSDAAGGRGWNPASGLTVITSAGPEEAARNIAARAFVTRFKGAKINTRNNPFKHDPKLTVLNKSNAPAVLIEYGFHTNREDVALLKDFGHRDQLAMATALGICDFLGIKQKETIKMEKTNREKVKEHFGFSDGTMDFLETYKYASDLLRKLAGDGGMTCEEALETAKFMRGT